MIRALFFDLDGTLLDTVHDIRASVNQMLRAFSYPEISEMQARAYVGNGARKLIARALPADAPDFEACYAYFTEHFTSSENIRTTLFEGEMETLRLFKERGMKLAVITNKPQPATYNCISRFFPENFFDFIGGDSGMFPNKPDPSYTRYAALTLRVPLRDCVFIGDGETDVLTAKNSGMRGVSVLWGYRTREELEAAGAREFVSSYAELKRLLINEQ